MGVRLLTGGITTNREKKLRGSKIAVSLALSKLWGALSLSKTHTHAALRAFLFVLSRRRRSWPFFLKGPAAPRLFFLGGGLRAEKRKKARACRGVLRCVVVFLVSRLGCSLGWWLVVLYLSLSLSQKKKKKKKEEEQTVERGRKKEAAGVPGLKKNRGGAVGRRAGEAATPPHLT